MYDVYMYSIYQYGPRSFHCSKDSPACQVVFAVFVYDNLDQAEPTGAGYRVSAAPEEVLPTWETRKGQ